MKRYVCLFACLLLMVMSIPVVAVPEEDGYNHLEVLMDCLVDPETQTVVVGLRDENGGAVNGYVYLEVDGEQLGNGVNAVDHDDRVAGAVAKLSYASVPATAMSVEVVSKSYTWDVVLFEEARQNVTVDVFTALGFTAPETTATTSVSNVTRTDTTEATVVPEQPTMTTAVSANNREQLTIEVDPLLAEKFDYSEAELESRIKAYVNGDDYAYYVGNTAATIHLKLTYDEQVSQNDAVFTDAKNADDHFSSYTDEEVNGIAFAVSLIFTDENGDTEMLDMVQMKYDMEMVIPASMQKTKGLAFAIVDENGQLSQLQAAYPSNGAIVLTLNSFQSYALIGFGTQEDKVIEAPGVIDATLNVFNTWQTALLFVAGAVLVIGGIVLLIVLVVKRRSTDEEPEEEEEELPMLSEETCKIVHEETPVKSAEHRSLDAAIPVIHHVNASEPLDEETFSRLSEQVVTPAKPLTRPTPSVAKRPINNGNTTPTVDELLDELTADIENLSNS